MPAYHPIRISASLLLLALPKTHAWRTSSPNCTLPPYDTNYVGGPPIRGSISIVWSCLFTLLICTYTIQHLNIPLPYPYPNPPKNAPWYNKIFPWIRKKVLKALPKIRWMTVAVLLPEILLGKALQDVIMAKRSEEEMGEFADRDGVPWTAGHAFFANMGGFVIEVEKRMKPQGTTENATIYLNAKAMLLARRSPCEENGHEQLLAELPHIEEEEIEEKSKGDFFVKAGALVQVVWLLVQICVRAKNKLVISQLEFAVLGYAACAVVTCILTWSKPQDVVLPRIIKKEEIINPGQRRISEELYNALVEQQPRSWFVSSLRLLRLQNVWKLDMRRVSLFKPPPNDARYDGVPSYLLPKEALLTVMDDGVAIGGLVFGALHCAAWNSPFPTPVERLLWRIASVASAGFLPFYYLILLGDIHISRPSFVKKGLLVLEAVVVVGYVLARLTLVVEMFCSLCFLPPEAFRSTWATNIPHVGQG